MPDPTNVAVQIFEIVGYICVIFTLAVIGVCVFLIDAYRHAHKIGIDTGHYCPSFDLGPFSIVYNPPEN